MSIEYEKILGLLGYSHEYIRLFLSFMDNYKDYVGFFLTGCLLLVTSLFALIFIDDEKLRFNNKLTRCISDGDWYIPPVLLFGGLIVITLITLYLYKPVYDLENAPEFRDYQKELALIKKFKDNPDWVMKSDLNTDSKNLVAFCLSPSFDFDSSSEHNGMRRIYHHVDIPSFEGDDWLIGCLVHHDEVLKYLRYKEVKEKMGY